MALGPSPKVERSLACARRRSQREPFADAFGNLRELRTRKRFHNGPHNCAVPVHFLTAVLLLGLLLLLLWFLLLLLLLLPLLPLLMLCCLCFCSFLNCCCCC